MASVGDSFTFTVGKLDAGMAILIGERAHLIEFPSILLPPGVTSGSIVNIAVHRNITEEKRQRAQFWELQDKIFAAFGKELPKPPKLEIRNVTQTSVTLQWPSLELATAKLRSLEIYRNDERLAAIPQPLQNTSTKLSGLDVQTDYKFQLVLRTTAGTFHSNIIKVKTHAMSDTSGISVCFGNVQDPVLLEQAKMALTEMKAKWSDRIQIDTTHFVCTTPAAIPSGAIVAGNASGGPGVEYQKALQLSIPIVQPQWVLACLQQQKMVPISSFYLGATPNASLSTTTFTRPKSQIVSPQSPPASSSRDSPKAKSPPPNPNVSKRASVPISVSSPPASTPPRSAASLSESEEEEDDGRPPRPSRQDTLGSQKSRRTGTMDRSFKFPPEPSAADTEPPKSPIPNITINGEPAPLSPVSSPRIRTTNIPDEDVRNVELPPPTPAKPAPVQEDHDLDEEVGDTVEVDLT